MNGVFPEDSGIAASCSAGERLALVLQRVVCPVGLVPSELAKTVELLTPLVELGCVKGRMQGTGAEDAARAVASVVKEAVSRLDDGATRTAADLLLGVSRTRGLPRKDRRKDAAEALVVGEVHFRKRRELPVLREVAEEICAMEGQQSTGDPSRVQRQEDAVMADSGDSSPLSDLRARTAQDLKPRAGKRRWWTVGHFLLGAAFASALIIGVPAVWHRLYPPADSTCFPIGKGATALAPAFRRAYNQAGGEATVGCGLYEAHGWGQGMIQNLRGGQAQRAAIMSFMPEKTLVLAGDEWSAFVSIAGDGTADLAGYPIAKRRWGKSLVIDLYHEPNKPSALLREDGGPFLWIPAPLWQRYVSLGGPDGQLGAPIGPPEGSDQEGWRQRFEHGSMVSHPGSAITVSVSS